MRKNKRISVQEAAAEIKDGDTIIIAGFTVWRKPLSIIYELVRQQRKDLHLIMANPSIDVDILVGAGCLKIWESNYCAMEIFGKIANNFARAVQEGKLICEDYGHYHTILRLQAGAMGVPFLPSWSCLGTDLLNPEYDMLGRAGLRDGSNPRIPREKFRLAQDPFYKEGEVVLLPAARADVCIAHVQRIGDQGTVRIDGQRFGCVEAMKAADKLIVVAEEVVPEEYLRRQPDANVIPHFRVEAYLEVPFGAHPCGVYGYYDMDAAFISEYYNKHSRTQEAFDNWADEWIIGVPDHKAYLNKLGAERLTDLRVNSALMVMAAAKEVKDGEVVFAGTGLPMVAIMAAQHSHAPNAILIYEAGTIDGRTISLPGSVADPRCVYQASVASGVADVMETMQRGWVDLGYLGGAEIDKYGNVNATCLGNYCLPKKRFPGSGGNVDINSLARRVVFIMVQEKRRFREEVDYITSPGWRVKSWKNGNMEWVTRRERYQKMFRGGPASVITDMAVFRFDESTGLMYLDTVHPGRTVQDVKDNVGFDLDVSRVRGETEPPTYEELDLLYKKIDTEGIFLP